MRIASRWATSFTAAAIALSATLVLGPSVSAAERPSDPALIALREAADPSNAVEAYAAARAARLNPALAAEAYVRRMVEFGLPEMADAQALDLIQRDPRNALGWGVVSYMETKRGRVDAALEALVRAARLNPDEAFVLQTAGQLLAWYDVQKDKPALSDELAAALVAVRVELDKHPIYTNTHEAAKAAYLQAAPAAAGAVAGQPAQPGQPGAVPPVPMIGAQPQFAQQPIIFNPVIQQIVEQPEQVARPYYPYYWFPVTRVVVVKPGHGHGGHDGPGHGGGHGGHQGGGGDGGGAQNPPPAPTPAPQVIQRALGPVRGVSQSQPQQTLPSLPLTGQTRASRTVLGPNPPQSSGIYLSNVSRRSVGGVSAPVVGSGSNAGSGSTRFGSNGISTGPTPSSTAPATTTTGSTTRSTSLFGGRSR